VFCSLGHLSPRHNFRQRSYRPGSVGNIDHRILGRPRDRFGREATEAIREKCSDEETRYAERNSHQTATDLAVRLLLFKLIIRLANLVAVWWLLVLEFRFSAGEYQFKLQSMPEPTCRTFCATFSGCFDGCSFPTFVHFAAMGCNKQVGLFD